MLVLVRMLVRASRLKGSPRLASRGQRVRKGFDAAAAADLVPQQLAWWACTSVALSRTQM
jgi:hypothetical protein